MPCFTLLTCLSLHSEITPEGRRITKLDQILLNGNNITMVGAMITNGSKTGCEKQGLVNTDTLVCTLDQRLSVFCNLLIPCQNWIMREMCYDIQIYQAY